MADREEMRKRLKERLRDKRNNTRGGASAPSMQDMLLKLAGDDPQVLRLAQQAMQNPTQVADMMKTLTAMPPTQEEDDEDEDVPESLK